MKFQRTFVVGALCAGSLLAVTPHAAAQRRSFDASDVMRRLEGHYGLWKTAISGAAVNDLVDEYALSDGNVSERYGFGGFVSPFRDAAALRAYAKQSPLTYARNIHTPTLILTDLRDSRVPPTQSFEMYHALQENGTHVEFRGWPIAGHNPSDPVRSIQRLTVWTEWLDRWLK